MLSDRQLTITDYWMIVRRYRWLLIIPFIIMGTGAFLFSLTLPDIYRASSSVLVEAPKVPESYVQSTVSMRMQERLRTITQQIKSRTRLEQVARELGLISNSLEGKALDDYITTMSNHIEVTVQGAGNDIFIVSYEGPDPRTVMVVANKLVSLFIDDNLKMREQYAEGTTEFLEGELQRVGKLLQAQEKTVAEYKQRSTGELPAQQDANQRALDRLQMQLQSIVTTLESVRTRKSFIRRQVSINVGQPRTVRSGGRDVLTSIFKSPVTGTRRVTRLNVEGDAQGDLRVHGGIDKAVYVYPSEHYEYWRAELPGVDLPWGSFGENLTTEGLTETDVRVGDTLLAGTTAFVVTRPRMPCFKLGIRFERPDMVKRFLKSGRSGFYLAVSREGEIAAGSALRLEAARDPGETIAEFANRLARRQNGD